MDELLISLIDRLKKNITIEENFDTLRYALTYLESDPKSSLTKFREILERILRKVYLKEMNEESKQTMIGRIIYNKKFATKIEPQILDRIRKVNEIAYLGPHAVTAYTTNPVGFIGDLCEIVEWYRDKYEKNSIVYEEFEANYILRKYRITGANLENLKKTDRVFVEPRIFTRAENILKIEKSLIILGHPYTGKTSLALYLAKLLKQNNIIREFIMFPHGESLQEIEELREVLVIFDEPFGGATFNQMSSYIGDRFIQLVRPPKYNYFIVTSREDVFNQAKENTKLGEITNLNNFTVNLSPQDYSHDDRKKMLYNLMEYYGFKDVDFGSDYKNWVTRRTIVDSLEFPLSLELFVLNSLEKVISGEKDLFEALLEAKEIEKFISRWFLSFFRNDKECFYFLLTLSLFPDETQEQFSDIYKLIIDRIRKVRKINIVSPSIYDLERHVNKTTPYVYKGHKIEFTLSCYRQEIFSRIKSDFRADLSAVLPCFKDVAIDGSTILDIALILPDQTIPVLKHRMINDWRRVESARSVLNYLGEIMPGKILALLEELVFNENWYVSQDAQYLFRGIGQNYPDLVIPILLKWLQDDSDSNARITGIRCLGHLLLSRFEKIFSIIEKRAKDDDWAVRQAVGLYLGNHANSKPDDILPILDALAKDESWLVARAADFALNKYFKASQN